MASRYRINVQRGEKDGAYSHDECCQYLRPMHELTMLLCMSNAALMDSHGASKRTWARERHRIHPAEVIKPDRNQQLLCWSSARNTKLHYNYTC